MPTYVRTDRCDGCRSLEKPVCVHICPHDLMRVDLDGSITGHATKAYNQEPEQCWECYACVKICPRDAIAVRHYADVVPLGASVHPARGTNSIAWRIEFRNGTVKRFEFPIRTTSEGSADPHGAHPDAALDEIGDHGTLFTRNVHDCDASQFIGR